MTCALRDPAQIVATAAVIIMVRVSDAPLDLAHVADRGSWPPPNPDGWIWFRRNITERPSHAYVRTSISASEALKLGRSIL
jgi:hypothetical protein